MGSLVSGATATLLSASLAVALGGGVLLDYSGLVAALAPQVRDQEGNKPPGGVSPGATARQSAPGG
ncbi:MAG: hypothetical protein HYY02_05540 [Chloroflexi bacterium]|nr:hypothetical protein [Chloroflexota bacterium]